MTHPVQNVGHADLVELADGSWAAVHLGVRVQGSTPGFHVLGRETYLAGVEWIDGWPVFDDSSYIVPTPETAFSEKFDGGRIGARWVASGTEPDRVIIDVNSTGVSLIPTDGRDGLLCTRVQDLRWEAQASFRESGSLRVRVDDHHWYGVIWSNGVAQAIAVIGDLRQTLGEVKTTDPLLTLRIDCVAPRPQAPPLSLAGPDDIVLAIVTEAGETIHLGRLDGRYLSTEVASGFTGRLLAVGTPDDGGRLISVDYRPA